MWDVLTNLFDTGTPEHSTAQVNNGRSHKALCNIVSRGHPAIVEDPSKLVLHRPTQGKLTLLECFNKHSHHLMLQSFIENARCSLNQLHEKYHFISGCKHNYFIQEQTRCEKDVPQHKHKFKVSSVLVTAQNHLDLPNSPTKKGMHDRANKMT